MPLTDLANTTYNFIWLKLATEQLKQDDWDETFFYLILNKKKLSTKHRNYLHRFMITLHSLGKTSSSCQETWRHLKNWHNFFSLKYINSQIQFCNKQNHYRTAKEKQTILLFFLYNVFNLYFPGPIIRQISLFATEPWNIFVRKANDFVIFPL